MSLGLEKWLTVFHGASHRQSWQSGSCLVPSAPGPAAIVHVDFGMGNVQMLRNLEEVLPSPRY